MSLESLSIRCEACDFASSSMRIWGQYLYKTSPHSVIYVNRTAGWCYSCQNISPIEDFTDYENVKQELQEYIEKRIAHEKTMMYRLFSYKSKDHLYINDRIVQLTDRLRLYENRVSPPKCLECGSTDVVPVKLPYYSDSDKHPLNFIHPNCGGTLYIQNTMIRFTMRFTKRFYDVEGNRLDA